MKKIIKSSLSLVLALTVILSSAYVGLAEAKFNGLFAVKAEAAENGICGENLTWSLNDKGVLMISGSGDMADYLSAYTTPWSKFTKKILSIVVRNGVTSIGDYAFSGCKFVEKITIADSVLSIGNHAFDDCRGVSEITIPDSVITIGDYAFYHCLTLGALRIPDSVTHIGKAAFNSCSKLETVTLSNNLKSIEALTFAVCPVLKSITIPDSVTAIKKEAFDGCWKLESIEIPDTVTHIEPSAFAICGYFRNDKNWEDGVLYIGNHLIKAKETIQGHYEVKYGTKTISGDAFKDCDELVSVTIPDTVSVIGTKNYNGGAFEKCKRLESVVIHGGETSIESYAFSSCNRLNSLTLSEGVISIGDYAFYGCKDINSVTIPDSVTDIGAYAFYGCEQIPTIKIPGSVSSVGKYAFSDCISLASVTIHEGVESIGEGAFKGCGLLSSVTIPDSVISIGDYAFGYNSDKVNINDFIVCAKLGTVAENYAKENKFSFVDSRHNHVVSDWRCVQESTVLLPGINVKECSVCKTTLEIEVKPLLTPEAPVVKADNSYRTVKVSWNDVEGADDYVVYRRVYDPKVKKWSGWSRIADGITKKLYFDKTVTYFDGDVESGTYYIYTVKARNDGGYGSYTSGAKIYNLLTPDLISLEHNQKTTTFKWKKVQGATGYIVYRRDLDGSNKWTEIAKTKETTYVDKNIKIGEHYKYSVKAYYGSYRSHFHEAGLQIIILLTPKLKSVSCDKKGVSIKWNELAGADSYIVYRRTYNAKTKKWSGWSRIADEIRSTSYLDDAAKSGTYYIYTIKAETRESGKTTYSGYDKTGLKLYFLATPSIKSATSTKSGVKLQWNKVGGATSYKVYRKTGNNPWGEAIATVKGNSNTTYVDRTAKKGVTYTYTVRACNGSNKSSYIPTGGTIKDKY